MSEKCSLMSSKQCRPWLDATLCGIWSESTLLLRLVCLNIWGKNNRFCYAKLPFFWWNCKHISEATQEMPQSQSTALPRHQRKEGWGTNNGKTNATYSKTCVRQPPLKLTLAVDMERWLFYKGTCHVILLAKLHGMYLYKTDNFFHINHYFKSVSKVALLHRFYW